MRRSLIAVILVSMTVLAIVPVSADAAVGSEYESPDGTYVYSTYGTGSETSPYWCEIVNFYCEADTVFIQSALEGYPVTTVTSLSGCEADTVVLPRTVTTLADGWFSSCSAGTLVFLGDRPGGDLPEGVSVMALEGTEGWDGTERIQLCEYRSEGTSFTYYVLEGSAYVYGQLDDDVVVVPDEDAGGVPFVGVDSEAFRGSDVTSLELGANVAFVGTRAFYLCGSLETVVLGGGVRDVRDEAFRYCASLADVDLSGVVTVGFESFRGCNSFEAISIPDSVTMLGGGAFYMCASATSVDIGSGIDAIPERGFGYCTSLEEVDMTGATSIGDSAFINCTSLTHVVLDDGTVSIGRSAFSQCMLLEDVQIGGSLETVGAQAFYECRSLSSLTFPDTLREVGSRAFYGCRGIDLYFEGDMPEISGDLLQGTTDATVHVYDTHLASWESWEYFEELVIESDSSAESDEPSDVWIVALVAAVVVAIVVAVAWRVFSRGR